MTYIHILCKYFRENRRIIIFIEYIKCFLGFFSENYTNIRKKKKYE